MCRLALRSADEAFSPYDVLTAMEAMQEGYDGSGLGLLLRGVEFEDYRGSSSFGVDLMYTGIKSTPNDGRLHEQSGYHHVRARAAGTMGNRRPGTGHGNDTP